MPEKLSDWNVLNKKKNALTVIGKTQPYDLATPLFSDYALKFRTVTLPEGQAAIFDPKDTFDFPVGTIVTKTFYYKSSTEGIVSGKSPAEFTEGSLKISGYSLIETRILARREEGWVAFPYVWNNEQTEATLQRTGAIKPLTYADSQGVKTGFAYMVPNQNQCAGCHATDNTTRTIEPIGLKARHLNKTSTFDPAFNQLEHWRTAHLLDDNIPDIDQVEKNADWFSASAPLKERARAYLDINCSHCHNPVGPADTSGLNLEPDATGPALGVCKNPIAAGSGSGGHKFDIVPGKPEASIFVYRMESTAPGAMMPELGRALVHKEGVSLIREWISSLDGECNA